MQYASQKTRHARWIAPFAIAAVLLTAAPAAAQEDAEGPCAPDNVTATTTEEGILLTWNETEDAMSFQITRTGGGEEVDYNVDGSETSFLDTEVEAGVTYTYKVQAFVDQAPSMPGGTTLMDPCGEVEATAIPVFPTIVAAGLALVGGVGAYAGLRRRG